jgi:cyanophycinase
MIQGVLIPIGGNEDKGYHTEDRFGLDFISEGILWRVVNESGGPDAKILVITSASSVPDEVAENYMDAFGKLECTNVRTVYIDSPQMAESNEVMDLLNWCDCLMYSGGNQSKITEFMKDTKFHQRLMERYENEKFVIAGTSAGAMCMAHEMIAGGSSTESFFKGAVLMKKGLALLPELIIDTHFIQRGRFGRIAEAVAHFPKLLGVGLAEDTGLLIREGHKAEVIGSGMVIIFDPHTLKHNLIDQLKEGTPLTMTHLTTHVLSSGDYIDLRTKEIRVLPAVRSLISSTES